LIVSGDADLLTLGEYRGYSHHQPCRGAPHDAVTGIESGESPKQNTAAEAMGFVRLRSSYGDNNHGPRAERA